MARFAFFERKLIDAWDAEKGTVYRCIECCGPLKLRKSKKQYPHFYHSSPTPSCRLYSKSENHLLLQLQLQKILPPNEAVIEKPILPINRIADVFWAKEQIAFEIQCSLLFESQAEARTRDYQRCGIEIVWILDDQIYNKKHLRPGEEFLRSRTTFFATVHRTKGSEFYDQFEIFHREKRIKKGRSFPIDFQKIQRIDLQAKRPAELPSAISRRLPNTSVFFDKDLIHRMFLGVQFESFRHGLEYWRILEIELKRKAERPNWFQRMIKEYLWEPYLSMIAALLKRMN